MSGAKYPKSRHRGLSDATAAKIAGTEIEHLGLLVSCSSF